MKGFFSTLATIGRLAAPYFRSEDRWPGRVLLGAVIAIELTIVAINVAFNQWYARFYNALQDRNWDAFTFELLVFCGLAAIFIVLAVYQIYLRQWLVIRWRRWMTRVYLERWLDRANHYRMQLLGDAADNPDQRIAEDINLFVDRTLAIGVGMLGSFVTFLSFIAILWSLSNSAPLRLFGHEIPIPGYLVWVAIVYAVIGTALTHLIGRPLIRLNFFQQRFEADFRFNLVRVRENAEQIALLQGEEAERGRLLARFTAIVDNWIGIMVRTKLLTFFTATYNQISRVFPFIVVSPAYFAGRIQLGGLVQTATAFDSIQTSLSFFVTAYRDLAEWRAVVARLSGFDASIETAWKAAAHPPAIATERPGGTRGIALDRLRVTLPDGAPLVAADSAGIAPGDHVLVTGPTGSGKSSLFRAIAGIWPFGSGRIALPPGARVMMLPQRPYFPLASLDAAVSYPAEAGTFDSARVAEAITAVGLEKLAGRLSETEHWNRLLSLGEQQRLAIARALLHAPDYLFLDEATASLDEPSEAALYRLIRVRLPHATIVSIGHRSALNSFHERRFALEPGENRFAMHEREVGVAAE